MQFITTTAWHRTFCRFWPVIIKPADIFCPVREITLRFSETSNSCSKICECRSLTWCCYSERCHPRTENSKNGIVMHWLPHTLKMKFSVIISTADPLRDLVKDSFTLKSYFQTSSLVGQIRWGIQSSNQNEIDDSLQAWYHRLDAKATAKTLTGNFWFSWRVLVRCEVTRGLPWLDYTCYLCFDTLCNKLSFRIWIFNNGGNKNESTKPLDIRGDIRAIQFVSYRNTFQETNFRKPAIFTLI